MRQVILWRSFVPAGQIATLAKEIEGLGIHCSDLTNAVSALA